MLVVFKRELMIPLSAVALCAGALIAPPRMMPVLTTLFGAAMAASLGSLLVGWLRSSRRPSVAVLPPRDQEPASRPRTQKADDVADLVRMDDDGGGGG